MNTSLLKNEVKHYWNQASCGTEITKKSKFSYAYFEEIEEARYRIEPEIFSFAQFTRFHGKKMLEVGVGAGSDFLQWVRAGTQAHGIDLTQEAVDNVRARLKIYGLEAADLRVGDAENLPYPNNSFDLVYSWGVIHHSPDTERCLAEIIRVTRPSGSIKVMVYNRHSFFALYQWIRSALFKGKPFQGLRKVLFNHQESLGTKAYTRREIKNMTKKYPVTITKIDTTITSHDLLYYRPFLHKLSSRVVSLVGWKRWGWFMMIELRKV